MRRKRLLKLADYIENHPEHFDMNTFARDRRSGYQALSVGDLEHVSCDSVGCVAGTAVGLFGDPKKVDAVIPDEARKLLGLTYEQASSLFYGGWVPSWVKIDAQVAAAELRRLAAS